MSRRDEQRERRAIIESEHRQRNPEKGDTYFSRAQIDAELELGGRYKQLAPTPGGPVYPPQPSTAPGNQAALVGDEPPLGFSVDALEPVGTPAEVDASIAEIERLSELIEPSQPQPTAQAGDLGHTPTGVARPFRRRI